MSNIDKQALREVAEKATRGPWEMERENIWFTDEDGYTKHLAYVQQGDDVDDKQDHYNTAFIAVFNRKSRWRCWMRIFNSSGKKTQQRPWHLRCVMICDRRESNWQPQKSGMPNSGMPNSVSITRALLLMEVSASQNWRRGR